ncbi:MAG: endolytic transglycosylase MltG [Burkholderiales bacterium]|jgi:UPF0755 protein
MKRFLAAAVLGLIAVAAAGSGWIWWRYERAPLDLATPEVQIEIERGTAGAAVGAALRRQGVDVPGWLFALALRWRGDAPKIRAGNYEIAAPITLRALLDRLTRGDVTLRDITLIEGWTFRQVRAALAKHPDLRHEADALTDAEVLARVGATETHPEGLFAPDTYAFAPGDSDLGVLRRAYRLQQAHLQAAWDARMARPAPPPYRSPYEALIMASIIEKETGREEDRVKVAAVFVNRLRRGMMLQSDPTTIYGLGDAFDGNLRRRDLVTDTPYNTYTRTGLTPTPISMPGRASIAAALDPAPITALYFVARGDGSSEFSNDLASHNRAVARYQKKAAP